MRPLAHIGNIPVEEWLPFVVPLLAIYLYVRRRERRRRAEVQRVVEAGEAMSDDVVKTILGEWSAATHGELRAEHVQLMRPPGPNGATARELAERMESEEQSVRRLLVDLAELGYVEEDAATDDGEARVWLTAEGFALAHIVERALLASFAERGGREQAARAGG